MNLVKKLLVQQTACVTLVEALDISARHAPGPMELVCSRHVVLQLMVACQIMCPTALTLSDTYCGRCTHTLLGFHVTQANAWLAIKGSVDSRQIDTESKLRFINCSLCVVIAAESPSFHR